MSVGSPNERFGPYLVYEQLGVGGMAQVHRAIGADDEFQRPFALKRMLSHLTRSEEMVKSFVREARLASYLRHENVPQTYDLGRVGDVYFMVMELITGRNLRTVLRHCGATTGPMPVPYALNILNQVCDALDYAHNLADETGQPLGIIHRDVSPSNVIVSDTGVVKLIDFGVAKASAAGMQTMSGTLKGKFAYMAPEYIAGSLDARADLFALGVIAHELLTNRPLFAGRDDIETLTRVRDMKIEPPSRKNPNVPPEIDDIVMTALQRDPDKRWQHATALRSALTTLTKRLGLVASNAQLMQWLDWAFMQVKAGKGRPVQQAKVAQAQAQLAQAARGKLNADGELEPDTENDIAIELDADEEPSISIEQHTPDMSTSTPEDGSPRVNGKPAKPSLQALSPQALSQKLAMALQGNPGDGTPEHVAAHKSGPAPGVPRAISAAERSSGRHQGGRGPTNNDQSGRFPNTDQSGRFANPRPTNTDQSGRFPSVPSARGPTNTDHSGRFPAVPPGPRPTNADQSGRFQNLPNNDHSGRIAVAHSPSPVPIPGMIPPMADYHRARTATVPPPLVARPESTPPTPTPSPAPSPLGSALRPPGGVPTVPQSFQQAMGPSQSFQPTPMQAGMSGVPTMPGAPQPSAAHGYPVPLPTGGMPAMPTPPPGAVMSPMAKSPSGGMTLQGTGLLGPTTTGALGLPSPVAGPFGAPRPSTQTAAPPLNHDPARSAAVHQDFARRVSAQTPALAMPTQARATSHVMVIVLVVLAAAVAAATVYFVLPLLS